METKVIIQSLYYLSYKMKRSIDTIEALKLIFFADKYHLQKYFRSITDDTYYAMEKGPVASNVKDILGFNSCNEGEEEIVEEYLEKKDQYSFTATNNYKIEDLDYLSETDKEALDFSIENFGKIEKWTLSEITHCYPEWERFKISFTINSTKREKIHMEDFFEDANEDELKKYLDEDPFKKIPLETKKLSKEFFFQGE